MGGVIAVGLVLVILITWWTVTLLLYLSGAPAVIIASLVGGGIGHLLGIVLIIGAVALETLMAYLRDVAKVCLTCGKPATVELLSVWNTSHGFFCKTCGQDRLKTLLADEKKADRAVRW